MPELFFPRVGAVVRAVGIPEADLAKVERLAVLYSCRFITSKDFRILVKSRFGYNQDLQLHLLELKDQLDFSSIRNNIYRALVDLIQSGPVTATTLFSCASAHDLDAYDLDTAYNRLLSRERAHLQAIDTPGKCSGADVDRLLRHVLPIIKNLVHRKLSFIVNNDSSEDYEDLTNLLSVFALRVIREYEVQSLTWEHLIKNVVVSLKNFTANLAEAHGRQKRSPVHRVKRAPSTVTAWHLDVEREQITPVQVRSGPHARVQCGNSLKIFVKMPGDEKFTLVHYKRLYANEREAQEALCAHRKGLYSKRATFLDLSIHTYDEFQKTCASVDSSDPNGLTLLDRLHSEDPREADVGRLDFSTLGPVLGEFADLVLHPEEDEFFVAWTAKKGIQINKCSMERLGTLACKFLGIEMGDVVQSVLASPAAAWSDGAKRRIDTLCEAHYSAR